MKVTSSLPRVLTIAGSDSGGGAGIQADIKTITCLGGYAASAITALTAQNTRGVFGIHEVPPAFVRQQIELVLSDIGADAIKTGMLESVEIIDTVASALTGKPIPLILDPVMVAKGGAALLKADAVETLKNKLIPLAYLVTPNIPEAELLADMKIYTPADMERAAKRIADLGARNVLVKGGHLDGNEVVNILLAGNLVHYVTSPRIETRNTHGTGCTLASAIATYIARGEDLKSAVEKANVYVLEAIRQAPEIGHGHGPLKHNWT